jgi:hypothetical protein
MTRRLTTPSDVPPDTLTIMETARTLRIGRSSAYNQTEEYERTGGKSGLPFVWVGGQKRVPRAMLERLLGGPITWPIPDAPAVDTSRDDAAADATTDVVDPAAVPAPIPINRGRAKRADADQLALDVKP